MGMKKTIGLSAVALAVASIFSVAPAQADADTVAVIDVHFEPSLISGDTVSVCVVSTFSCNFRPVLRTAAQYQAYNHGTIMADIIRQTNTSAKIIMIKAALAGSVITGSNLNAALDWVRSNAIAYGIDSVSFSYNAGNGATCRPAAGQYDIEQMNNLIVKNVADLKAMGINVYAASGNHTSTRIDYPACIQDVVSVGSNLFRGSMPLSDVVITGLTFTSNTLRSDLTRLFDSSVIGLSGANQVRVGHTTSVATAIAAAKN